MAVDYDACLKRVGSNCSSQKVALVEMLILKGLSKEESEQDLLEESKRLVQKFMVSSSEAYKRCVKTTLGSYLSGETKLAYSCTIEQASFAKVLSGRGASLEEVRNKLASIEGIVRSDLKAESEKVERERQEQAEFERKYAAENLE